MAGRAKARAPQPIALKPHEQASLDAMSLSGELSGIRCLAAFLGDMEAGSTSGGQIPEETQEWLRGLLIDWIRDRAGQLEGTATRLEQFLDEHRQPGAA